MQKEKERKRGGISFLLRFFSLLFIISLALDADPTYSERAKSRKIALLKRRDSLRNGRRLTSH